MEEPLGLRDRKKVHARRSLAAAALELFERQGYHETTVADIARAADMSPRTFFRYFGSKEDVVFSRTPGYLAVVRHCLRGRPPGERSYHAVRGVLIDYAGALDRRKERTLRVARVISSDPALTRRNAELYDTWSEGLAQELAARARLSRPTPEDRLIVRVALAVFGHAFASWIREGTREPLPIVLSESYRCVEAEICAEVSGR